MDLLVTKDICKQYEGHVALDHVSISIPRQSIFGLLGPNGAGKTTLIRTITQLVSFDSGSIYFQGEPLAFHHLRSIGYLPEERGLYKRMTVADQLLFFAELKKMERSAAVDKVKDWLKRVGLLDWANKNLEDLSKGMQQKVQFIAAVVNDPALIILDEPFTGFDPVATQLITKEILQLREKGSTIIFSTHRMENVEELCDHVVLMNKSKKILDGTKEEIKRMYDAHAYAVEHIRENIVLSNSFQVISQSKMDAAKFLSVIKIVNGKGPDDLLSELIEQRLEIHSFQKMKADIRQIFIQKVNETAL
jgi:ABC-2 type transport system ATP-binding protein